MTIGLCTSVRNAAVAAACGVDFIEEHVQRLLAPEEGEAAFEANALLVERAELPVPAANCFLPGHLKCVGPDLNLGRILEYAKAAFGRARRVGIGTIVFGSGQSRTAPAGFPLDEAFGQYVDVLRALGPIAADNDILLVVEPLNKTECNIVNRVSEGAAAVERCGHPNVLLLADIYHMLREEERPESIREHARLIRHVHLAERDRRTAPGVAGDDFRPYLAALQDAGYDGGITIECNWGDLASELPRALECLKRQLEDAAG